MTSKLLSAILVSFLAAPVCFGQDVGSQSDSDVAAADRLQQSGNLTYAIALYKKALTASPGQVAAQSGLIRAYLRNEQVDEAYELAKSSLVVQPTAAPLLSATG